MLGCRVEHPESIELQKTFALVRAQTPRQDTMACLVFGIVMDPRIFTLRQRAALASQVA